MTTATVIELKDVESGRIKQAGYDEENFVLYLRFHPTKKEPAGAVYGYPNVGEEMADDFFHADSLGTYFAAHLLKNPDHPSFKVEGEPAAVEDEPQVPAQAAGIPEIPEDEDELKLQALAVAVQVKALSIVSSDEYLVAGNELVRLREMRKRAQERVDRLRKPAYDAYQATLELQRDVMKPYDEAEAFLDRGMAGYRQREKNERLRLEAEENRRRREEAEAEAKRKAKELAEADAKVAEAQGQPEVAAQIRQQPLPLTPVRVQNVVLPKDVPKVKGIIERAPVWKWRVRPGEDHLVPREYLTLNEKAINAAVTNQKSLTNIAGIEVWDEEARVGVKAAK
jgi:hypothetical protein